MAMDVTSAQHSPPTLLVAEVACILYIVYLSSLSIYRIYFSRISHIPGPRLAAITYYYQSYYDL